MKKMLGKRGPSEGIAVAVFWAMAASTTEGATLGVDTVKGWANYVRLTEQRIASELESKKGFLVRDFMSDAETREFLGRLQAGEVTVLRMKTRDPSGAEVRIPSGMIHHWLGSVFIPGVELEELLRWLQNYPAHQRYFDEVEDAELLSRDGDVFEIFLRLRRRKIVTVYYNTEHHVEYRRHGPNRVSSKSASTRVAEVDNPGTSEEREKPEGEGSGFLWRLNSYWRYQEVSGGVIVECETISLSRDIPGAVRWLFGRYVDSVPRESMAGTLDSIRTGVARTVAARGLVCRSQE